MSSLIGFLVAVLSVVGTWMVYKKIGREGWESIIPFYNAYVLFEELYGNGWRFLTLLIPFYNIYVAFKLYIDLAHGFNKSTGFGIGLTLLNPIFMCLLGLDNNVQYNGGPNVELPKSIDEVIKPTESEATQLAKYKQLLDDGAISEEEYEQKKNELLHL